MHQLRLFYPRICIQSIQLIADLERAELSPAAYLWVGPGLWGCRPRYRVHVWLQYSTAGFRFVFSACLSFSNSYFGIVAVDNVSQNFLQGTVSGLLGLAFTALAETGATPFWLALMNDGQISSPEMSFFLKRLVDDSNAPEEAPGGTFTIGGTNSSFFSGNIEFTNLVGGSPNSFWLLQLSRKFFFPANRANDHSFE